MRREHVEFPQVRGSEALGCGKLDASPRRSYPAHASLGHAYQPVKTVVLEPGSCVEGELAEDLLGEDICGLFMQFLVVGIVLYLWIAIGVASIIFEIQSAREGVAIEQTHGLEQVGSSLEILAVEKVWLRLSSL